MCQLPAGNTWLDNLWCQHATQNHFLNNSIISSMLLCCTNLPFVLWGPFFVGPLFGQTCWICLNPSLFISVVQNTTDSAEVCYILSCAFNMSLRSTKYLTLSWYNWHPLYSRPCQQASNASQSRSLPTVLSQLKFQGLPLPALHQLFTALIVNKITYALPAFAGQLTADDRNRVNSISRKVLRRGLTHTAFDIDALIDSFDRKLFRQTTQPGHCLHHLLPPKTSTCHPYRQCKRQHPYQLSTIEFSQYKNSFQWRNK